MALDIDRDSGRPLIKVNHPAPGVELRNVRYRGKLVLFQAHVPILDVRYDGSACGPFRDWLWRTVVRRRGARR